MGLVTFPNTLNLNNFENNKGSVLLTLNIYSITVTLQDREETVKFTATESKLLEIERLMTIWLF